MPARRRAHRAGAIARAGARRDRRALWSVLLAAMLLLGAAGWYRAVLSPDAASPIGGPFELVDGHGQVYSDRSLRAASC